MNRNRRLIISLHGIRTKGDWQEKLETILKPTDFIHKPFKFGYYDIFRFINPYSNRKMVEQFYTFYYEAIKETDDRPSIVAHSFGTFIAAHCLLKRPDIKFDKIVFCGSILSKNFDWSTLIARNQVNQVRNEYSRLDIWARFVKKFIKATGSSGYSGSSYRRPNFFEERFDYDHSDYFSGNHMKEFWLPFLSQSTPIFCVRLGRDFVLDDYYQTLSDCRVIDRECYAGIVESPLPEGLTNKWISINNDIYTFVFEEKTNVLQGYINAIPLTNLAFEKLKKGEILDGEIKEDDIVPFVRHKKIKVYFLSIATRVQVRQFRGGLINTAADRLLAGFFKKLTSRGPMVLLQVTMVFI